MPDSEHFDISHCLLQYQKLISDKYHTLEGRNKINMDQIRHLLKKRLVLIARPHLT